MFPFKGANKVTSGFRLPDRSSHNGIDIIGKETTASISDQIPIYAVAGGTIHTSTIVVDGNNKTWEWGNYVRLDVPSGERHYYCHMDSRSVVRGQVVNSGDIIGIMGNTGKSEGVHLHFEVRNTAGASIDPSPALGFPNAKGIYYSNGSNENNSTDPVDPPTESHVPVSELNAANDRLDKAKNSLTNAEAAKKKAEENLAVARAGAESEQELLAKAQEKLLVAGAGIDRLVESVMGSLGAIDEKIGDETKGFIMNLSSKLSTGLGECHRNSMEKLDLVEKAVGLENERQQEESKRLLERLETSTGKRLAEEEKSLEREFADLVKKIYKVVIEFANLIGTSMATVTDRLDQARNAITGRLEKVETGILDLFELHRKNALSADEYERLNLPSILYDRCGLQAYQYDKNAGSLLEFWNEAYARLTAKEYENLQYEAIKYDRLELSATDYDIAGKLLLKA